MAPFKVGDITTTRNGRKARIICVDRMSKAYPVVALIRSDDDNAEVFTAHTSSGAYHESGNAHANDLMPTPRLEDLAIDAPILVRNYATEVWEKRHFAKASGALTECWLNGMTSWTAEAPTSVAAWNLWKLP